MKRWKLFGKILLAVVALQLLADGLYAMYVAYAASEWEATIERDAEGVLAGCDAYDLPAAESDTSDSAIGDSAARDNAAPDTAILLVHGINASPRHYDLVAPALAERGYACRVMRLPGFCEPLERYSQTSAQAWTGAVASELAALRAKHERVGVVAHSLGGAVTINVLLEEPEGADFAVLLAPAVAVSGKRSPLLSTRAWHEVAMRLLWFTDTLRSPFPMDCHDPERTDHAGRVPFTPVVVIDELFGLMDRNLPRAAEFTTPVTMILSQDDVVIDTPAAEAYFGELGSAEKRLLMLKRSGHAIPLDQEWRDVVNAIDEIGQADRDVADSTSE